MLLLSIKKKANKTGNNFDVYEPNINSVLKKLDNRGGLYSYPNKL